MTPVDLRPDEAALRAWRSLGLTSLCAAAVAGLCGVAAARHFTAALPADVRYRIDPNTATQTELELLRGIGPKLAQAIITHRESLPAYQRPAFRVPADLNHVPGVDQRTVEGLSADLRLSSAER